MTNAAENITPPALPVSGGGRPKSYRLASGERVPSVTTITGRFKDAGGLVRWAYNCGRDGIDIDEKRDSAADAGGIAHDWIEDTIHGRDLKEFPLAPADMIDAARTALEAFLRWRDQVKLEVVMTEVPLVSELLRFGGTYDALFKIAGGLHLGDWKSGNRIYPEHVAQLGGYAILLREQGIDLAGAQLIRVDKEFASFSHFGWTRKVLDLGEKAFRMQRELYDVCAQLKKVAA